MKIVIRTLAGVLILLAVILMGMFLILPTGQTKTEETSESQTKEVIPVPQNEGTPLFLNEHYRIIEDGLYEVYMEGSEIIETLTYFDFNYFSSEIRSEYPRVMYLGVLKEESIQLQRLGFTTDQPVVLEVPADMQIYLITESIPTYSAYIVEQEGLENASLSLFSSHGSPLAEKPERAEGGSRNPRKILIQLEMSEEEGFLIYEDGVDFGVRSTEVQLVVKPEQ